MALGCNLVFRSFSAVTSLITPERNPGPSGTPFDHTASCVPSSSDIPRVYGLSTVGAGGSPCHPRVLSDPLWLFRRPPPGAQALSSAHTTSAAGAPWFLNLFSPLPLALIKTELPGSIKYSKC